eukprot:COSAG01_NODE_293_length_19376_cov_41.772060_15_plen_150_part_00
MGFAPSYKKKVPRAQADCESDQLIRVRVEIMGSQKCGIVGKSQSLLIMNDPMISTRTRTLPASSPRAACGGRVAEEQCAVGAAVVVVLTHLSVVRRQCRERVGGRVLRRELQAAVVQRREGEAAHAFVDRPRAVVLAATLARRRRRRRR